MDLKLYEYPREIDVLLAMADDGELSEEQVAALDQLLTDLPAKVHAVVACIKHLEMLEERCQAEQDRLRQMRQSIGRRVQSIKTYLLRCMAHEEVDRVVSEMGTVTRAANSRPRIIWDDSYGPVPEEYTKTVIETKVDGDKVYRAYVQGRIHPGFVVELGENLRIK